jgi:hypothetical protein
VLCGLKVCCVELRRQLATARLPDLLVCAVLLPALLQTTPRSSRRSRTRWSWCRASATSCGRRSRTSRQRLETHRQRSR